MSKVNPSTKGKSDGKMLSDTRLAGGAGQKAAKQTDISLLRRLILANLLWEDNAYVDGIEVAKQIAELIPKCDPKQVQSLAIESRQLQKMRHVPLYILAEMLKHEEHKKYVAAALPIVCTRPDMMTDFLAIYQKGNSGKLKPLAAAAKKGLAATFDQFSEYQFAKYDRDGAIRLRDVMFLTHPTPETGRAALYKRIANTELKVPDTWEVALSSGADRKETWTRLIEEGKLGALAFLRNLRNMKDAKVDHNVIRKGFKTIKSQMLLPLNFFSAAKYAPEFKSEVNEMMLDTYSKMPKLPGYSIFIIDVSGSMSSPISGKSTFDRMAVASAMGAMAQELCEKVDIYVTAGGGSVHKTQKITYPKRGLELAEQVAKLAPTMGGGGIFTRQCIEYVKGQTKQKPERIMVFSDSQDCDYGNDKVPKPFGEYNYIVDVAAHQNGVNYKGVWTAEISGWSEHFLTYIAAYEGIENTLEEID